MTNEEQIEFPQTQERMKSQLEFANSLLEVANLLKQCNQNDIKVQEISQESIVKLESYIQLLQNKLELEALND
jgi:hypothetical protein